MEFFCSLLRMWMSSVVGIIYLSARRFVAEKRWRVRGEEMQNEV